MFTGGPHVTIVQNAFNLTKQRTPPPPPDPALAARDM